MQRRRFLSSCTTTAAAVSAAAGFPASWAADARPKPYARAQLVTDRGDALRAATLKPLTNYVFHYPYEATPVFLLDLARAIPPLAVDGHEAGGYSWPGGVGRNHSIVAFSAICAHQLVYPTREVSFISFRRTPAAPGGRIHCCSEHSEYDPARGAEVQSGPARQPLCAVLLAHDPASDTLTAYATLGGELFDAFFRKYEMKLAFEEGPRARNAVAGRTTVLELERFCRNPIRC
jgi:Rieske Fe-S protein